MNDVLGHVHLAGCSIIRDQADLDSFLNNQRQDYYSKEKIPYEQMIASFRAWIAVGRGMMARTYSFYAVRDEKDDHAKNDGWGKATLLRGLAIRLSTDELVVLTEMVQEFYH